ncbi:MULTISPECIES: cell division protein FtsQ/DivIB [Paracoccus]|uniref:Cell division protein FtsQ n=1 Tax=Paracoccus aerius TaxID=1915382 RepID=A0ABS1S7H9_9RHOB|nr:MULTISPECIES: cell division protein FtsQ/DivIB [Paracoccus]MBL3673481.1 cell division protein FtsQ/DivIB [Paracoccus aerius]QIR85420.1 cell division protein FtsQ [Paracoccus sp. AK26]GHG19950.1 cell division protein FtsQ [Paracoccus aerius]
MPEVIDHRPNRPQPQPQGDRVKRDPAPTRLQYRLERMWLRPIWRRTLRIGVPAFLVAMTAGLWLADEDRRALLSDGVQQVMHKVQSREEFQVRTMMVEGASPVVDKALRAMLPVELPASSFDIDLTALRLQVMQLDVIESVDLRIKPGGILSAVVKEREPAILWRHARGIEILDKTGHRVASVTARDVRPDLPLIAGESADMAVPEALALIDAAGPILPRVRGLVRRGERRWDLVLDQGQRIMLPAQGALTALEAAIALDRAQDLLGRDIAAIDLRNPSQPVMRLGIDARNSLRQARGEPLLGPDGKIIQEEEKKGG